MNSRVSRISVLGILFSMCLPLLQAQLQPSAPSSNPFPFNSKNIYESSGASLVLRVFDDKHRLLDRQSVVKLENKTTQDTVWQTTADESLARFRDLKIGQYEIEVSAVGYIAERMPYSIGGTYNTYTVEVVLRRDPTSVELNAPTTPDMPKKARKATLSAVRALKSGNLKQAQKQLESAYKLVPESADVNFLLGYLYFQRKDFSRAQSFLAKSVTENHRNVQALTLLGRVRLHDADYGTAQATLEEAIATDPGYWTAHYLLSTAYLNQHEYEKSRAQAQLAIDRSKGAGNSAYLVLGQALANLGHYDEAIAALDTFLRRVPSSPQTAQVKDLIDRINVRKSALAATTSTQLSLPSADSLVDDTDLRLSIKAWQPPGVDQVKPPVSAGVTCPQGLVISQAGAHVKQLVEDISKFAAVEQLVHERVDELGNAITRETRHYNYFAGISETKPGYLEVQEYRTEHSELAQFPDNMASRGFISLAFVFHPEMWDNFEFSCEGMGELRGQPTWLVHFRQREDRPNRIHDFKIGGMIYSVSLKGRAWITPDKFQIVRIESELVKPMPNIQLLTEHQIVEYGPVQFKKKGVELWLPKTAELYFDFRKHRMYRRHSFDHYMLFSTESEEKQAGPKQAPKVPAANAQTGAN